MLNVKSAQKLFDIMINANTCHKMNALGQRMLHGCFAESELFGVHNVTYMYMHLHVYLVSVHIDIHSTCCTFPICTKFVMMCTFIYTSIISYLSFLCFSLCKDRIGFQGDRDKNFTFFVLLLKNIIVRLN